MQVNTIRYLYVGVIEQRTKKRRKEEKKKRRKEKKKRKRTKEKNRRKHETRGGQTYRGPAILEGMKLNFNDQYNLRTRQSVHEQVFKCTNRRRKSKRSNVRAKVFKACAYQASFQRVEEG